MKVNKYFQQSPEDVILENLGLVKKISKRYLSWIKNLTIVDQDDIISVGTLGLMRAYEIFNPNKTNMKFSTYASYRIRTAINRYLYDFNPTLTFPRRARECYYKIFNANLLEKTQEEITEALHMSISDVQIAMEYAKYSIISTSISIKSDEDFTIEDLLYSYSDYEFRIYLSEIMELLSDTQKKIFYYHFIKDCGQSEISNIIDLGQPAVSRNIKKIKEIAYDYLVDKDIA